MATHLCEICGALARNKCSKCKAAWYCSRAHQRDHWRSHRHRCGTEAAKAQQYAPGSTTAPPYDLDEYGYFDPGDLGDAAATGADDTPPGAAVGNEQPSNITPSGFARIEEPPPPAEAKVNVEDSPRLLWLRALVRRRACCAVSILPRWPLPGCPASARFSARRSNR